MNYDELEKYLKSLPDQVTGPDGSYDFTHLHAIMAELSKERYSLTPEADIFEMKRIREQLFPTVHQSTFCKYVFDKPRGYAGDFITQEMIWLGRTEGGSYLYNGTSRTGELMSAGTQNRTLQ